VLNAYRRRSGRIANCQAAGAVEEPIVDGPVTALAERQGGQRGTGAWFYAAIMRETAVAGTAQSI